MLDMAMADKIVRNLYYDVLFQFVLLITSLLLQIGLVVGIIIYAIKHRGR
jgi:hypothetical protein